MQFVRRSAEAFANAGGGQVHECADAADAEFVQFLTKLGLKVQAIDGDGAGAITFFFRAWRDNILVSSFGAGVAAKTGPADGDDGLKTLFVQFIANLRGPGFEGGEDVLQTVGVEPEDAGFVRGGFDQRAEVFEPAGEAHHLVGNLTIGDDAGTKFPGESESGGVAHTGEDAIGASPLVGPLDESLRLVVIHHHGGFGTPVWMLPEEDLKRQRGEINTSPLVHDRAPVFPSRVPGVCL